jgi:hypothetical protein
MFTDQCMRPQAGQRLGRRRGLVIVIQLACNLIEALAVDDIPVENIFDPGCGFRVDDNPLTGSFTLGELSGQCRMLQLPLFVFQEGVDASVEQTFRAMAKISGGAYARFDAGSASHLSALLGAVASYAAGGHKALENQSSDSAKLLLQQLKN